MSTLKVNEIRHISNTGTANVTLESNENVNLRTTSTQALTVNGTLTVSNTATLNGNVVVGNASSDTLSLTSTVSGKNNYSGFTGEIKMYAGNAAGNSPPVGWLYCNGDTVSQTTGNGGTHYNADGKGNDYQDLFNLLKASSDWGNSSSDAWGTDTVKLPDFRSRSPVGVHTGADSGNSITAGLTERTLSDTTGTETHALITAELAAHNHSATMTSVAANITAASALTLEALLPNHVHPMAHTHTMAHTHSVAHDHGSQNTGGTSLTTENDGDETLTISSTNSGTQSASHTHGFAHTHTFGGDDNITQGGYSQYSNVWAYDAVSTNSGNGKHFYTMNQSSTNTSDSTEDHTHDIGHSHAVSAHSHTIASHLHTVDIANFTGNSGAASASTTSAVSTANTTNPTTNPTIVFTGASNTGSPSVITTITDATHAHVATIGSTGSGTAHNNISPIIAVHYIIKV